MAINEDRLADQMVRRIAPGSRTASRHAAPGRRAPGLLSVAWATMLPLTAALASVAAGVHFTPANPRAARRRPLRPPVTPHRDPAGQHGRVVEHQPAGDLPGRRMQLAQTADHPAAPTQIGGTDSAGAGSAGTGHPVRLTPREMRIVYLMSAGRTTPEIADQLDLRPRTVENHKRHIYEKLGVSSQSQAVATAISMGLLDAPEPTRQRAEPGRPTLGLVYGAPGEGLLAVTRALLAQDVPFVVMREGDRDANSDWESWHRGPVAAVLVDPSPEDWAAAGRLGVAMVVVVHCGAGARDQTAVIDALTHGASGLVLRDEVATDLGPALTVVSHGLFVMSGAYANALAKWAVAQVATAPQLTARERDILSSIASGHTIRQTARALGIAAKTVENTQARLFRKLGARNRTETITIADGWGLVDRTAALADRHDPAAGPGPR
jgi:DNA-binding NarL/FixJ family response regulator